MIFQWMRSPVCYFYVICFIHRFHRLSMRQSKLLSHSIDIEFFFISSHSDCLQTNSGHMEPSYYIYSQQSTCSPCCRLCVTTTFYHPLNILAKIWACQRYSFYRPFVVLLLLLNFLFVICIFHFVEQEQRCICWEDTQLNILSVCDLHDLSFCLTPFLFTVGCCGSYIYGYCYDDTRVFHQCHRNIYYRVGYWSGCNHRLIDVQYVGRCCRCIVCRIETRSAGLVANHTWFTALCQRYRAADCICLGQPNHIKRNNRYGRFTILPLSVHIPKQANHAEDKMVFWGLFKLLPSQ